MQTYFLVYVLDRRRSYSVCVFFQIFHMSAFGTSPVTSRTHSKKTFLLRVTKDPHLTNIASNVRCMGLNQNLFHIVVLVHEVCEVCCRSRK